MVTFVSDEIRKASREMAKNVDTNFPYYGEAQLYVARYRREPTVRAVPAHYFEGVVVAFTRPDEGEIAMPPIEKIPYENGVHSWEFVLRHEKLHNYIHDRGGIQNERDINDHVAYTVGPKYGIDRFPFPSY